MTDVLVVQTAFLGDVVLTTPLLRTLADRHGPVDVVTIPTAAPLLETLPTVREVVPFDKRGTGRGTRGLLATASVLRHRRYGIAYAAHRSWRTALLLRAAGIPTRVGYDDAPGRSLYTEQRARTGAHESLRLVRLADPPASIAPPLELVPTEQDRVRAGQALRSAGIDRGYVVLAPGSAQATKRWPHYAHLAERLAEGYPVVAVGASHERGLVTASGTNPVVDLAGRLSVREMTAVVEGAAIAVTNDSAPLHIAGAVGTPVVALFGPTHPRFGFGPLGPRAAVVQLDDLACRPCSTHGGRRCPLAHHRCLRELPVDRVLSAVQGLLDRRPEGASTCG